jgi:hypothetical protein
MFSPTKLEERIMCALRSGANMDFTYRNISRALRLNGRPIRRSLQRLLTLGVVSMRLAKGVAVWAAP